MRSTTLASTLGLAALLAFAAPATASAAPSQADRAFLDQEARGAAYELAIAQLATQQSSRSDIKAYSQRVVSDHETANAALRQLAQSEGVSLPTGMTEDQQTRLAGLRKLKGSDFDNAYLKEVKRINAEDKTDFAKEAKETHDPDISSYVKRFSAMDAEHEKAAEQLPMSNS